MRSDKLSFFIEPIDPYKITNSHKNHCLSIKNKYFFPQSGWQTSAPNVQLFLRNFFISRQSSLFDFLRWQSEGRRNTRSLVNDIWLQLFLIARVNIQFISS